MGALFGYGCLIALLLACAARIGEYWLSRRQWPQRWVWLAALSAFLILPAVVVWLRPASTEAVVQGRAYVAPARADVKLTSPGSAPPAPVEARALTRSVSLPSLDVLLQWLWVGLSCALACLLAVGVWRLQRQLRRLPRVDVDGVEVCIAEALGPAVFGLARPRIILPRWLLEGSEATRSMVLLHERAHLQARDPLLLAAALLLIVLLPWNLPLWWQLRRLRLAIEVDCDRRVLRQGVDIADYCETLLAVGQHRGRTPLGAMAFTASRSQLEHRIRIMTDSVTPRGARLLLACGAASLALVVAATRIAPPPQLFALTAPAPPRATVTPPAAPARLWASVMSIAPQPAPAALNPAIANEPAAPTSALLRSASVGLRAADSSARAAASDLQLPRQVSIEARVVLGNDAFKRRVDLEPQGRFMGTVNRDVAAVLEQAVANDEVVLVTQPVLLATDQREIILSQPAQMSYEEFSVDDELVLLPRKLLFNFVATPRIASDDAVDLDLMLSIEHVDHMIRTSAGTVTPGVNISSMEFNEQLRPGEWIQMEWTRSEGLFRSNPKMGDKEHLYVFITARALPVGLRF